MPVVIDHDNPKYRVRWNKIGKNKYNGAFYYSKEIVQNIIPLVETDRNWVTINCEGEGADHSIVFIHNNLHPEHYEWLQRYKDLILVCGVPQTMPLVEHLGYPIYLPLSIDCDYVSQFAVEEKTQETAFVGRYSKRKNKEFAPGTDFIEGLPRIRLLEKLAQYRDVYAVGRCAIEAKLLGCNILPYDDRYPDPELWQVLDNKDAAKLLQKQLNKAEKEIVKNTRINTSAPKIKRRTNSTPTKALCKDCSLGAYYGFSRAPQPASVVYFFCDKINNHNQWRSACEFYKKGYPERRDESGQLL